MKRETLRVVEETRERELKLQQRKRRLEHREEEFRKSLGSEYPGFRGYVRVPTPVDSHNRSHITPDPSRPASPQPTPRRRTPTSEIGNEIDYKREIENLRREIEMMKRMAPFAVPSPVQRTSLLPLRDYTENVPKFDGHNISVTQFTRACRRAFESLPFGYTSDTEASLTRLLLSKLSGHAYFAVENLKITRVEVLIDRLKETFLPSHDGNYYRGQLATERLKSGEHVLEYVSRMRELTQSVMDEESKNLGQLTYSQERKIENERLDAFSKGLPRDYRMLMRFENYDNFDQALTCLVKVDKQLREDDRKFSSDSLVSRKYVANIRPIKKNVEVRFCNNCKRTGHLEESCWQKHGSPFSKNTSSPPVNIPKSPTKGKKPVKKRCSYCKRIGHSILECRTLKYKLEKNDSGNAETGAAKDARRSLTIKVRPKSPVPVAGPNHYRQTKTLGTTYIRMFREDIKFHVVNETFPIRTNGILGNEFLASSNESVCIPSRSSKILYCHVLNSDISEGYLPRFELPAGIFAGEVLVKNNYRKGYFKVCNTTPEVFWLEIPRVELIEFKEHTLPSSGFNAYISASETNDPGLSGILASIHKIFTDPNKEENKYGKVEYQESIVVQVRNSLEELLTLQEKINLMKRETLRVVEETRERELKLQQRKRRLEHREEEFRKSLGSEYPGFRGYVRVPTPVDSHNRSHITPDPSRPASPQPTPRRRTPTSEIGNEIDYKREIENLRREIEMMKRMAPFAVPSPVQRTSLLPLRDYTENVPKFDGHNISVTQFTRACRRAFESLPFGYTSDTEASLTRLLLSKLSGHAYFAVENLKITRVEVLIDRLKETFLPSHDGNYYRGQLATERLKSGEHVLEYVSRMRELTQSVMDEESKNLGQLTYSQERKIENERLDAFSKGLPRDYRMLMRFENYDNFDQALTCLVKVDKQLREDDRKFSSDSLVSRKYVANIRPIKKNVEVRFCNNCKRTGHLEESCWQKHGSPFSKNTSSPPVNIPKSPTKGKKPVKKRCSYCKRIGHSILECRTLKYKLEKNDSGNAETGAAKDARRSLTIKVRPKSPVPVAGPNHYRQTKTLGTTYIRMFREDIKFHVVNETFPIRTNGILGNEFLASSNESVCIPSRSSKILYCHVLNSDISEGYLPRFELPAGIFAGEVLVKNNYRKGYFKVCNTTPEVFWLEIPRVELIEFKEHTLPSSGFNAYISASETNDPGLSGILASIHKIFTDPNKEENSNDIAPEAKPSLQSARAKSVKSLLHLDHLNLEEARSVMELVNKSADIFHLPGDPLGCTDVLRHRIFTSDNIPVHTKQYRFPPVHKEEILRQTSELLENGIIKPSISPYNSLVWIVPKKADSQGKPQ
ncbi:hypothetical protein M0802_014745 [Mischocyttarus mexicanus]|nr:hypothetical protein M0802_014745 [Mischocyttarus mexicanus]